MDQTKYRLKVSGWLTLDVPDDLTARRKGHEIEAAIRKVLESHVELDQVALVRHGDRESHNLLNQKKG